MSEHTKGRWQTYANDGRGYQLGVWVLDSGQDGLAGYECLCEVRDPNRFEGGVAEAEANARLMASAPDLLEALAGMVEWQGTVQELVPDDLWNQVQAALAKAKGEVRP